MKKMYIETFDGEILIGEITVPPQEFIKQFGEYITSMFNGIWLKRAHHVSFIAKDIIKVRREATIVDKEVGKKG
jgi:hypothetical protein